MDAASYYSWMVIVSTTSALIALVSAGFGVINQWKSWRQASRPNVVLFLQPRHGEIMIMDLVIANIGQGAARDIDFRSHFATETDESLLRTAQLWIPGKNGIRQLPFMVGNSQIAQPMGISWSMIREKEIWPLTVIVEYSDASKSRRESEAFPLDPRSFSSYHQLGSPPLVKIADALDKLQKKVGDFGFSDRLRVEAIIETLPEYVARREAEMEELKETVAAFGKNEATVSRDEK